VNNLKISKSIMNKIAKTIGYSRNTYSSNLRPTRVSTQSDQELVINQIKNAFKNPENFKHSSSTKLKDQRKRMIDICDSWANDNKINFDPPVF
jgi:hypothetical protein